MIFNMVGGGSGGLKATDAILRVIAPAGSTVTITKSGVSKSDVGHENALDNTLYDYYFIIHQSQFDSVNPWTVTATLGTQTISDTIIIDAADEYDMTLSYTLWLIDNGITQFGTLTALALKSLGTASYAQAPAISTGTGYVQIGWTSGAASGQAGGGIAYFSSSQINLSKYKSIHVDGTIRNATSYDTNVATQAWTDIGTSQADNRLFAQPLSDSVESSSYVAYDTDIDISSISDEAYIGVNGYRGTSNYTTLRIANMYLEA